MQLRLQVKNYDLALLGERGLEITRGELAHRALYFLDPLPRGARAAEVQAIVSQAVSRALALAEARLVEERDRLEKDLVALLSRALLLPKARPYFEAGTPARAEAEILDEAGRIHRIDRLVFLPDAPVILEFKLGERRPEHWQQVRLYRRLVKKACHQEPRAFLFYLEEPALIDASRPCQLSLF